jgi:WD40 repeat protein
LAQFSEIKRWVLVASGTQHVEDASLRTLDEVPAELERIRRTFRVLGYTEVLHQIALDPTSDSLGTRLQECFQTFGPDDVAVFYYTGHGERDGDRFYLLTRNSKLKVLDSTAIAAESLGRFLAKDTSARQILIILDTCYSGAGASEASAIIGKLASDLRSRSEVWVLAASRPSQEAAQGALSTALEVVLKNATGSLGGPLQRYFGFEDVLESVNAHFEHTRPSQKAFSSTVGVGGRALVFPNPLYNASARPGLDLQEQRALVEHWTPKVESNDIAGSAMYFTGRKAAVQDLAGWFSGDRTDSRTRVITGGPGSGKSAVLGRIVTLSAASTRARTLESSGQELLPEGAVDVAVHARRKLVGDIVSQIASRLELQTRDPNALLSQLQLQTRKTVVVVDALDEADSPKEIVDQVLAPMNAMPNVFLAVGTRPDTVHGERRYAGLGESTVEIDLDDPKYFEKQDIALYAAKRLLAEEEPSRPTPYRGHARIAHIVANAVAERAGKRFILARTAVETLIASGRTLDVSRPGWETEIPTEVDSAFKELLSKLDEQVGSSKGLATAVLLPLAFAEGEGLPWAGIWPRVAKALSEIDVTNEQIRDVLTRAAPFVVEALEAEGSVYRLYHESFAESLRSGKAARPGVIHGAIFDALLDSVPSREGTRDWTQAHPYLLLHLAAHGAKAGRLSELLGELGYLLVADRQRLLEQLPKIVSGQAHGIARAYLRASSVWGTADRANDRPPHLALALMEEGLLDLAPPALVTGSALPWSPLWAHSQTEPTSYAIARGVGSIDFVKICPWTDGRPVALVAREKHSLEVWDLARDALLARWDPKQVPAVSRSDLRLAAKGPVLICTGSQGELAATNLSTGDEVTAAEEKSRITALETAEIDGEPVCIVVRNDERFVVYRLSDLTVYRERKDSRVDAYGIELLLLDGQRKLVAAGDSLAEDQRRRSTRLSMWSFPDLLFEWGDERDDGGALEQPQGYQAFGRTLVIATGNPRPQLWDLSSKTLLQEGPQYATVSWLCEVAGEHALVSVGSDTLQIDYLAQDSASAQIGIRKSTRQAFRGSFSKRDAGVASVHGRTVLVAASGSRLRLWDIEEIGRHGSVPAPTATVIPGSVESLAVSADAKRLYAATRSSVVALESATGAVLWSQESTDKGAITSLALAQRAQDDALLVAGSGGVTIWDAVRGTFVGSVPLLTEARALATSQVQDRAVFFASTKGGSGWEVGVWSLEPLERISTGKRWSLTGGQGDKCIYGLAAAGLGNFVRIAFASKYAKVMIADFGRDKEAADGPGIQPILGSFEEWHMVSREADYVPALLTACIGGKWSLFAGSDEGTLMAWDLASGAARASAPAHRASVAALAFRPSVEAPLIVSGGADNIKFWTPSLKLVATIEMTKAVRSLAWVDGLGLAVGTGGGLAMLKLGF